MAYSTRSSRTSSSTALWAALLLASLVLAACGGEGGASEGAQADSAAAGADSAAAPAAARTASDDSGPRSGLAPNELGEILVLEYHRLGEPEGEFVRKASNFQKDLDSLYAAGFRPVTMR